MVPAGQHKNTDKGKHYSDRFYGRQFFLEKDNRKRDADNKYCGIFNGICDRIAENGKNTQNKLKTDR